MLTSPVVPSHPRKLVLGSSALPTSCRSRIPASFGLRMDQSEWKRIERIFYVCGSTDTHWLFVLRGIGGLEETCGKELAQQEGPIELPW